MKKLAMVGLVAFAAVFAFAPVFVQASTTLEEETVVEAAPKKDFGADVAFALDGLLGDNWGKKTLEEHLYVQFNWMLSNDWKIGIRNRIHYSHASQDIFWTQIRLFAEKKGFVDTGSVGNKYTLRIETLPFKAVDDGQVLKIRQRFDFTFPFSETAGLTIREQPDLEVGRKDGRFFRNRLLLKPFVSIGRLYLEGTVGPYFDFRSSRPKGATTKQDTFIPGVFLATYFAVALTDSVSLGLWMENSVPFSGKHDFWDNTFFDLELSVSI